jgi:predicted  nucleic acid-binding Zn-ribbon protein
MTIDENEQLREQVSQLLIRLSVLEHQVLQAKDQIVGDHARNGELLHRLTIAQKNNKKLREEVKSIHASTTWKLGRIVMLPIRLLKLVIRKLK